MAFTPAVAHADFSNPPPLVDQASYCADLQDWVVKAHRAHPEISTPEQYFQVHRAEYDRDGLYNPIPPSTGSAGGGTPGVSREQRIQFDHDSFVQDLRDCHTRL